MFLKQTQPQIKNISPYVPGKPVSELKRELGLKRISKLASNENPLGASLKVANALTRALGDIARYPDGNAHDLKSAISKLTNVALNQVVVGNGSNELLELVARVFAGQGDEVMYSQYAFAVYPISAQVVGATAVEVPAKNWAHDLPAMLAAITDKTKIIYLANPNNPTGTLFTKTQWEAFISQVPKQVIVVLDEAYLEYVQSAQYANGADYLKQYPNLLVSRTFSKAYGLASLRVGYMLGCEEIIKYLNQVRAPFNVNAFSQIAAVAAISDQIFVKNAVSLNNEGMKQLIHGFDELGLKYIPSFGNFVCVEIPDKKSNAAAINTLLLEKGVIVRPVANYGMQNYLRISVGTALENNHFLSVLASLKPVYA